MLFQLYGMMTWTVGYYCENRSRPISEEFEVLGPDAESKAVKKARAIIRTLHERYCGLTNYTLTASLRTGIDSRGIWKTRFVLNRPGTSKQPVQLATIGYFEEEFLIKSEPRGVLGFLRKLMKI